MMYCVVCEQVSERVGGIEVNVDRVLLSSNEASSRGFLLAPANPSCSEMSSKHKKICTEAANAASLACEEAAMRPSSVSSLPVRVRLVQH